MKLPEQPFPKLKQKGRDGKTLKLLHPCRVVLHQVVVVDSSISFQTGEIASTSIMSAWSCRIVS